MGSPLAPVLANIFMGFHESKWLNEYNLNKPKFYFRYVDDILAAFDNEQDSLNFLNILNNWHLNIKGATKFYFMQYPCVVIILFNRVYIRQYFIFVLLENYCFIFLCFLSALYFKFVVIFINLITYA